MAGLRKTLLEMRTNVRNRLDEVSPSFWTNADLNTFLNQAKDRVWMQVRQANQDYSTATRTSLDGSVVILDEPYESSAFRVAAGTRDFTLPPDFGELIDNRCVTSGFEWLRLQGRRHTDPDFRRALEETALQTPLFYTVIGERTWRVAPLSDTALDFRITYVTAVPDLAGDAETLALPHPLYMAVEQYATAEALMKDHSPDAAAWEAKGNATVTLFLGTNVRQSTDTPHVHGFLEDW